MDLLNLDRLNRGEPYPRATVVRELVERVVGTLEIRDHPIHVDMDGVAAWVDPAHLERIVENVIVNATKHTPTGTPVWVRAEERPDRVLIFVEEAGPATAAGVGAA
jgi:signal transduction histidine kinase